MKNGMKHLSETDYAAAQSSWITFDEKYRRETERLADKPKPMVACYLCGAQIEAKQYCPACFEKLSDF